MSRDEDHTLQRQTQSKSIGDLTKTNGDEGPRPNQSQTWFKSYLIDVVWDGRLWYNWTNITDDYSCQRSLTEWDKNGNRYVTSRAEMELSCTWWRISCGMRTQQRQHKSTEGYKKMTNFQQRVSCCSAWPWHWINKDLKYNKVK